MPSGGNSRDRRKRRRFLARQCWQTVADQFDVGETVKLSSEDGWPDGLAVRYQNTKVEVLGMSQEPNTYRVKSNRRKAPIIVHERFLKKVA